MRTVEEVLKLKTNQHCTFHGFKVHHECLQADNLQSRIDATLNVSRVWLFELVDWQTEVFGW